MTTAPQETTINAEAARHATAAFFSLFGLLIGTWAPHIPLAKQTLGASSLTFGIALLGMGLGGMVTMPFVGRAISRHGSAKVVVTTATLSSVCMLIPFNASSLPVFAAGLFVFGALLGALDVAMNAHGLLVERRLSRAILSSLHGTYSITGLLGGLLSAALIERVDEFSRGLVTASLSLGIIFFARRYLLPSDMDRGTHANTLRLPSKSTLGLGVLCMIALLTEVATIDWTGIFLRENFSVASSVVAINFALYSLATAISRFLGDRLRVTLGATLLARSAALLCGGCLLLGVISPDPTIAILSFAVSGFALGPIVPLLVIGGGKAEPQNPSNGISAVTTLGYLGSTLGPPFVGFVAYGSSLATALAVVALLSFVIAGAAKLCSAADVTI